MTEQIPVTSEASRMYNTFTDMAMLQVATDNKRKLMTMIFFRLYKSPKGIINNNPSAYPICVVIGIRLAVNSEIPKSSLIRFSNG